MAMEDLMAWQRAAYTQDALPTAPRAQEPPQQQEQQPAEGALRAQMFATATGASTTTGAFAPRAQGDAAPVEEGTQNVGEASLATFDRFVQEADDGDAAEVPSHQAPEGDAVAASLLHQPQAAVVAVEQERAPEATEEPARDLRGLSAGRERFAPEQAAELQEEDGSGVQAPEEGAAHPGAFQHALRTVNHEVAPAQDVQQAAEAGPPVPAVAVSQELSQAITHGARRVQMRIVPEGLGELDIKVQMTGQQVHLTIRGDAPELAQLLTHKVQELRQDLQQQGLSLGAMDFGTLGASSGGSSMSQDGRSQQSRLDDDGQGGLQRLAGAKESTSTGAPRSRPRGAGPSHRIIDVVL